MIPSQMLKGILEGCVLGVISLRETYGYEISQTLAQYGLGNITEGTIYPLLLRLEKNKLVTARYLESAQGPKRKYYALTPAGQQEFTQFQESFDALSGAVQQLFSACAVQQKQQGEDL